MHPTKWPPFGHDELSIVAQVAGLGLDIIDLSELPPAESRDAIRNLHALLTMTNLDHPEMPLPEIAVALATEALDVARGLTPRD